MKFVGFSKRISTIICDIFSQKIQTQKREICLQLMWETRVHKTIRTEARDGNAEALIGYDVYMHGSMRQWIYFFFM